MSKFFEALEQAEREQALQTQASAQRTTAAPSASPPPAASRESAPLLEPPVVAAAAPAAGDVVERFHRGGEHLVSLLDPASYEAEQYRVLRHVVETLRGASLQVVAVTSPGVNDGKTTTAINLAGALAQSVKARVLLVDLDLRSPTIAGQLGLGGARYSVVDALLKPNLTLEETAEHLPHFNLSVLPAGGSALVPYELLGSPRLEALLKDARQRYDYIVLDTPPFAPVPDCRLIAKCVDGFIIVVAAHRTPRGMLGKALDAMDPTKVLGLVFNCDDARRSNYYNTYTGSSRGGRWGRLWKKP
jgi:protein-tyrosine kinase